MLLGDGGAAIMRLVVVANLVANKGALGDWRGLEVLCHSVTC